MSPAGATEREAEPRLLLALVPRESEAEERHDVPEELLCRRMLQNVLAHRFVAPGEVTQLRYVEGVLHEADVEYDVCGGRQSVLVAEALDVHEHP